MSELDLSQKVAARRLLWRMGYSTRIDVVLRAVEFAQVAPSARGAAPESFTDLDVLGVAVTPSGEVQTSIVDCKTGNRSVIGRMFWVRGLVELFGAHSAYMVRDHKISADAKQLAARLGITALTEPDVAQLDQLLQADVPVQSTPLSLLFDADAVAEAMSRFSGLDGRLKPLLNYRQFDYWVHDDHRNLVELPDVLLELTDVLDPRNPQHVGLLLDSAWLYTLSLARCVGALRSAHSSQLSYGLSEYLVGGTVQLKQKHEIAELLTSMKDSGQIPAATTVQVNPRFFDSLLELVLRLMRRGTLMNETLRVLEFQTTMAMLSRRDIASEAFGDAFNQTAAKLAADVVEFLVTAASLNQDFLTVIRAQLTGRDSSAGSATPAAPRNDLLAGLDEIDAATHARRKRK
ncbi:UNVERIFIED_CONTAM: hypothetical protein OHV15_07960 [Microbacterium sp. SLM126]